jgi:drug/metabolite transporter (DMT)-like permease
VPSGAPPPTAPAARIPAPVLGVAFVLVWCTGYPVGKLALGHSPPFTLLELRFCGAGLIFTLLACIGRVGWPGRRDVLHSAFVGATSLALQFGCVYFAAARGVSMGLIALVTGMMPIATALIGLAFGEPVQRLQWLGFACGFTGVALAVGAGIHLDASAGMAAYAAMFASLLGISAGTVYQKRFASRIDPRSGLALQHAVGAALLLPFALAEGLRTDHSQGLLLSLGWLIGVNAVGGLGLLFVLLRRGAVNQVAALFFLIPPVTALLDYLVLREPLTLVQGAGIGLAALGVYLATRTPLSAPRAAAPRSYPTPCE